VEVQSRVEREVKLEVPSDFRLEDVDLGPGLRLGTPSAKLITSTYYDTSDLRLACHHASLRFREGEGWTVKLEIPRRGQAGFRAEHVVPASGDGIPEQALDLVAAFTRGAPLGEVARLRTMRKAAPVLNESGEQVAEIVDDRVSVINGDAQIAAFHEIEVELTKAAPDDLLDRIVRRLRARGATVSDQLPKLVRALRARSVAVSCHEPATERVRTVGGLVGGLIAESFEAIVHNDPGIRLGLDPENVHRARVATRRLRSDLRAFRSMLDVGWCDHLRQELAWLGKALGAVRDGEVLLAGLRKLAEQLPPETSDGVPRLLERLSESLTVKRSELLAVLRSERYTELLDQLANAAAEPRLADRARRTDVERLPRLMRKPWRKLVRAVKALSVPPTDGELHTVRICAKRCRYLAEALARVAGKGATRFAAACQKVQDVLGEHQDSVVARQWLRDLIPAVSAWEVFAAGQLYVLEQETGATAREAWPRAWRKLRRPRLSRWWKKV
jgi:CHAD domain-containing protein